nr:hypothetical protein [Xanthomonas vasicola]MDO6940456.1 hypothetical protein [Xanthomonas vasicola]
MAGKKKARLWEESVVIGLRDMQWRLQLQNLLSHEDLYKSTRVRLQKQGNFIDDVALRGVIPPGFVTLDGNAESSTADVALSSTKGFCFLVEVKPSEERIRDGLINATGKRSNRIRRAEGAQIADFLPVSARLRGVAWITG